MTTLSINSWIQYPQLKFWGTFWDAFGSFGTIISGLFLIIYPIYGAVGIHTNIENLEDKETLRCFGILYEDYKHKTIH